LFFHLFLDFLGQAISGKDTFIHFSSSIGHFILKTPHSTQLITHSTLLSIQPEKKDYPRDKCI
jgi:hypothetical protein